MLVGVQCLLDSSFVVGVWRFLIILVIKAAMESRSRAFYFWRNFSIHNIHWVSAFIHIRGSYEASLLRYKLVVIGCFVFGLVSSECLHSEIISIHSPRHWVNESWLVMVYEAIDFISILFDLLPLFDLDRVWALSWRNQISFPQLFRLLVNVTIMDPLLVHKLLHFFALFLSLVERMWIIWTFLVLLLSMLLWSFVSHLQVFVCL